MRLLNQAAKSPQWFDDVHQSITTDYSAPFINRLMLAAEKVVNMRQEPSLRLVNQKSHPISTHDLSTFATQSGASR